MGIHKLMEILKRYASKSITKVDINYFNGKYIACDASMTMYQFLVQTQYIRQQQLINLIDSEGNNTGHLLGLFNRTVLYLQHNITPIWVFDGTPPLMKQELLQRREKHKNQSKIKQNSAFQDGNMDEVLKYSQQSIKISDSQKLDAIKMLQLMGIQTVQAPGEAEAQCSELCKRDLVFATATEDMDILAFGSNYQIRGLKYTGGYLISYKTALSELGISQEEFIDFCILSGCDYTGTLKGVGPISALKLIKKYKNIENILENDKNLKTKGEFFEYKKVRNLFQNPLVLYDIKVNQENQLDQQKLINFMQEKGFKESRIINALKKFQK